LCNSVRGEQVGVFGTAGKLSFSWQHSHTDLAQNVIYITIFKVK